MILPFNASSKSVAFTYPGTVLSMLSGEDQINRYIVCFNHLYAKAFVMKDRKFGALIL